MQENNSAKIIARVDPEIADLIPGYLINREQDIVAIYDALNKKDLPTVRILVHSMKGSGGGYGFAISAG